MTVPSMTISGLWDGIRVFIKDDFALQSLQGKEFDRVICKLANRVVKPTTCTLVSHAQCVLSLRDHVIVSYLLDLHIQSVTLACEPFHEIDYLRNKRPVDVWIDHSPVVNAANALVKSSDCDTSCSDGGRGCILDTSYDMYTCKSRTVSTYATMQL